MTYNWYNFCKLFFFGRTGHQELLNEQSGAVVNDMFVVVSRLIRQLITNTPSSRNFEPQAAKRKWAVGSRFACKISTIDERVYQINIESYGCSMVSIVDVFVGISVLRFYVIIVMFLSKCFRISRWTSTTRLSKTIMSDMSVMVFRQCPRSSDGSWPTHRKSYTK